ncbi:hypothetical protein K469DRAFT_701857 [Zopfia rhizophila CBS 207.26]|uniref:Secreted protein n=1 Tax=Zopfia rhizophila CBS 207.26 TaxID=1314779 RepID=A0A6A6EFC0_9PEZI|nr:hypothetical protein K469DRAFT_701857 [Zopfia rhizophila CBS 207.26]
MCSAFLLTTLLLQRKQCLIGLRPLVLYYLAFGSTSTTISTGKSNVLYCSLAALLQLPYQPEKAMCSIVRSLLYFNYHINQEEQCALLSAF